MKKCSRCTWFDSDKKLIAYQLLSRTESTNCFAVQRLESVTGLSRKDPANPG